MQVPCCGGGQGYSAQGVPGWQRASSVCTVLPAARHAGDLSGEGPGRAAARAHPSASAMGVKSPLHREPWGAARQSRRGGMLVTAGSFLPGTERQRLLSRTVGSDCSPAF